MQRKGFTLIELLIVVAIIAILAAIAVPNFLEAQTRAKVSRSKADLRTLATGVESYALDWQKYPPSFRLGHGTAARPSVGARQLELCLFRITTPVSYMSSVSIADPFGKGQQVSTDENTRPLYMFTNYEWLINDMNFLADPSDPDTGEWAGIVLSSDPNLGVSFSHRAYALTSCGPNVHDDQLYYADYADPSTLIMGYNGKHVTEPNYDPTNGTNSAGDIGRFGGALRIAVLGATK